VFFPPTHPSINKLMRELLESVGIYLPAEKKHTTAEHSLRGGAAAEMRKAGVSIEMRDFVCWWTATVVRTGTRYEGYTVDEWLGATDCYGTGILWWDSHGVVARLGEWSDAWGLGDLPRREDAASVQVTDEDVSDVDSEESVCDVQNLGIGFSLLCNRCEAYIPASAPAALCDNAACSYTECIACHTEPNVPLLCPAHMPSVTPCKAPRTRR
jgi:hypothetical protein